LGRTGPNSRQASEAGETAIQRTPAVWIATVAGVGFFPLAPGTAGSLVAAVAFLATQGLGLWVHLVLVLAVTTLGVWASGASEAVFGRSDDGRIVIDEVAGQWIALTPLLVLPPIGGTSFFGAVVTGFVAFRLFDIWKPGPVRWAERRFRGGVGVMADDCVAGVLAAVVVALAVVWLAPGLAPEVGEVGGMS